MKRLLLDTNAVVPLLGDDHDALPATAVDVLTDERNRVWVSAVSYFEIAVKRSIGKLTLPDGWSTVLTALPFDPLPVTAIHAERVEHLPWRHRDPFDRLLVAQALAEGFALVTSDERLAVYGVEIVW